MRNKISIDCDLEVLLKEAVVKATFATPLRHNSVETFDEYNTGKNVGKGTPTVWWDIVPNSDQCEIYTYMAGGGCTLPGNATVLMPGEGYEGVTKFVLDRMTTYGLNACPPLLVGVGVGTSVETAALNSKKALMRPVGSHNDNANAAKMEEFWRTVSMRSDSDRRVWWKLLCDGCQYREYRPSSVCDRCCCKCRLLESPQRTYRI